MAKIKISKFINYHYALKRVVIKIIVNALKFSQLSTSKRNIQGI